MVDNIFNFDYVSIDKPINIGHLELLATNTWDYLFYRGQFFQHEIEHIRCIVPCPNCYLSHFNIGFSQFESNKVSDLVKNGFLSESLIKEKKLCIIKKIFTGENFYTTLLDCPANYAAVQCNQCKTKHLIILGLTETQPGLYAGQLHGIWKMT